MGPQMVAIVCLQELTRVTSFTSYLQGAPAARLAGEGRVGHDVKCRGGWNCLGVYLRYFCITLQMPLHGLFTGN